VGAGTRPKEAVERLFSAAEALEEVVDHLQRAVQYLEEVKHHMREAMKALGVRVVDVGDVKVYVGRVEEEGA